jgi:hypothetical protein
MQIVIDIPDRLIDNEFGYTDIRLAVPSRK